jgi:mannose-6-phosphate isomerase
VKKNNRIEKPWGFELIWANTPEYVAKLIVINAGQRLSKQYHEKKTETIFVMEGNLLNYDKDDNETVIMQGQSLHIEPGQVHRFCAPENKYVKVIEVSTNHLDDVVRISDDYGRGMQ